MKEQIKQIVDECKKEIKKELKELKDFWEM